MKLFRRIQFILLLSGLGFLFFNFANPKLAMESARSVAAPLKKAGVLPKALEPKPAAPEDRYVRIEGKLYKYNPRNVYNVNGVPTMYTNGAPKTLEQLQGESGAEVKLREIVNNPLAAYGPGGLDTAMEAAKEAAAAAEKRNRMLKELDQQ